MTTDKETTTETGVKALEEANAKRHRAAAALYLEARNIVHRVHRAETFNASPRSLKKDRGTGSAAEVLGLLEALAEKAEHAAGVAKRDAGDIAL